MTEANLALAQVLCSTWPVLLDFDGPISPMFVDGRNQMVATMMREQIPDTLTVSASIQTTVDP